MTSAEDSRAQILARIRAATASTSGPAGGREREDAGVDAAYAALPREYLRAQDIAELFAERAADYRAVVERVPESGLAAAVARVLGERAAAAPVVPAAAP